MTGFNHECDGVMHEQTANGKLMPNSNRFQIHCWWWENTIPKNTFHYTWYMRFGNDWFMDPKDKHLSFTITITHCPFCGVDLAEEYRRYWREQVHTAITSWIRLDADKEQELYDKEEYIRVQPIQESKTYKD